MKHAYPPDILQFVQQSLAAGEYASEDDVVIAAMRALRDVRQRHQTLRDDVQAAIAELDQGQAAPWDIEEMKAELSGQLDAEQSGD
jgi:putative addiction module CopG family antidote